MVFAIKAYDRIYNGSHGVVDYALVDCENKQEASKAAEEMSLEVIETCTRVMRKLEETATEEFETDSVDWDLYLQELEMDDIDFDIYPIDSEKSRDELESSFLKDPEGFIGLIT